MTNQLPEVTKRAADILGIPTLDTRHSDSLDFHDLSVWKLEEAIRMAWVAGRESILDENKGEG